MQRSSSPEHHTRHEGRSAARGLLRTAAAAAERRSKCAAATPSPPKAIVALPRNLRHREPRLRAVSMAVSVAVSARVMAQCVRGLGGSEQGSSGWELFEAVSEGIRDCGSEMTNQK